MATTRTYDPACYDLAKKFLADCPELNDERRAHLLALEIQEVVEGEIYFMRERPDLYR